MDIKSISDLLNEFKLAETKILNEQDIKHPTTIGTMYEGLTTDILTKTVFGGLNLKVIKNSFIEGCDTEFDIMLVEGNGQQIPYTDRYRYKSEQVIAIIQVKKNLYSQDIEEGYNNLKFIIDSYDINNVEPFVNNLFRDSVRSICKVDVTTTNISLNEEHIKQALNIDAHLPIRILLGYNGFKSEYKFRKSFFDYLQKQRTTDFNNPISGLGPYNFPNLIICGEYSMFKINGMPFIAPIENDWWPFYSSSSHNPLYLLMEVIWTRLAYKFNLPDSIFGEDLDVEQANRFLDCQIQEVNERFGWNYQYRPINKKKIKLNPQVKKWQPVEIDEEQAFFFDILGKKGEIDIADEDFRKFVLENGKYNSVNDFLKKLKSEGLIFVENDKVKYLTKQCACVCVRGKWFAGENCSDRLMRWGMKQNTCR